MSNRLPSLVEDSARDQFFGALYYETTAELLTDRMTRTEAALIARLLGMEPAKRYLDLGCGHGRHLRVLQESGFLLTYGLDRSISYLRLATQESPLSDCGSDGDGVAQGFTLEQIKEQASQAKGVSASLQEHLLAGDTREIPFLDGTFDGAYSWYSSLFFFDEEINRRVLMEAVRTLKPGGLLLLHGANPLRLAREPTVRHVGKTRWGGRVEEVARFDNDSGLERFWRRLTRQDGSVLEGSWSVRHYSPDEMTSLLRDCGCVLENVSDELGRPFDGGDSLDMITLARVSERQPS